MSGDNPRLEKLSANPAVPFTESEELPNREDAFAARPLLSGAEPTSESIPGTAPSS